MVPPICKPPPNLSVSMQASMRFAVFTCKLLRWYAPCCNAALFNTMSSPKWAFASLHASRLSPADTLGPVATHLHLCQPNGRLKHTNLVGVILRFAKRTISARLSGVQRTTPFFDDAGKPIKPVRHLTEQDRTTAQL